MGKPTVIFRADGSPTIGMGHFIRSLALAEMLNNNFQCVFATCIPTEYQKCEIQKSCHKRIDLPADDSHFQIFLSLLEGHEIVVLDNYYFDTEYQMAIKSKGCKLVCIDDIHDKHYVADIVINHAEGIKTVNYSVENYTQLLLGYKYALLRKDFLKATKQKRSITAKTFNAFINLGGSDPETLIVKTTNIFLKHPLIDEINLISKVNLDLLDNPYNKKVNQFWNLSAKEMAHYMLCSDIGFLPASTISVEACACRLPFIGGWFVENQINIYNAIINRGLAIGIGNIYNLTDIILFNAISDLTKNENHVNIITRQKDILDGNSDNRFQKTFKSLC